VANEFDLASSMTLARDTRGKSFFAQVREIASLAFSRRRLTAVEYYRYGLYDDTRHDPVSKARFLGEECHMPLIRSICDLRWWAITDDKAIAHTLLQAAGAPVPELYAMLHPFRLAGSAPTLSDVEATAAFLRDGATYPFFGKPVSGVGASDVHLATGYDADTDELVFHDGTRRDVDGFAAHLWSVEGQTQGDGYLLQEVLVPHPELARRTGPAVSGFRVLVVIDADGPRVIGAMWKIIGGDAIADNTWREDAMLAHVDLDSGEVGRVVRVHGARIEELTHHPVTGEALAGFTVPHWTELVTVCRRYAGIAPKVRFQGWDVAICEQGPRIIEVNTGSSFELTQIASGEGVATEDFERFVAWAKEVNETPPKGLAAWSSRI